MTKDSKIYALIVAAGVGARAGGGVPKQYASIGGKALLRYSVEALLAHPSIAAVQVVIHPDHAAHYDAATRGLTLLPAIHGGAERADSVRAGLAALAPHAPDYVLVHDAARPFLSQAMLDALIANVTPSQAVIPALPVADTVRRFDGKAWQEVSRDGLLRVQTPQAFSFSALVRMMEGDLVPYASLTPAASGSRGALRAPESAAPQTPTDEAAIWVAAGGALRYVAGDEDLRKVTTVDDIRWAENKAAARRVAVGTGFDVHALMPSGEAGVMRLAGVDIAHAHKLHGHSDADVVLHAIVDALLGAIAAGDIGSHFPPTDARWKGANSAMFVEEARAQVAARGGRIQHIDVTIICEAPKISPHRDAMREAIAGMLALPLSRISVKATTTEKLGFTGREEGIAAQAIATITLPEDYA